jgi:hypothetical protein
MKPRLLTTKRMVRGLLAAAAVLLLSAVGICAFFRITGPRSALAYVAMSAECHPIWRDLAWRRVNEGDSLAAFLQRYPPSVSTEFGRFGLYDYFSNYVPDEPVLHMTGVTISATDGRLTEARAWSCTWDLRFFGDDDP